MTRKEEREQSAKNFESLEYNSPYTNFIQGAEWSDNNPDKRNVYTKDELRKMGFGFDLNGNIVTPKEEEEMIKEYIVYKKKQWLDKACEWLKEQEEMIGISFQEDFIIRFREAMKGE